MTRHNIPRRNLSQRSELLADIMEYDIFPDTREIFLQSSFGNCEFDTETGIDWRMATRFNKAMTFLEHHSKEPIIVHVCSIGGHWEYGISIYDRITASPCRITTLSYAHARSMSSVLIQAAERRILMPNCEVLIHFGTIELGEDQTRHAIAEAKWAEWQTKRMLEIYASRCARGSFFRKKKYSKKGVAAFLHRRLQEKTEWYMDSRTAIEYGFADAILGDVGFKTLATLRRK